MALEYYEKVKERYELLLSTIDIYIADEFHYVSKEMIEKAIEWLKINL